MSEAKKQPGMASLVIVLAAICLVSAAVLGLINLDQNKIMKIFTLVSVLLMPPTLIASFYGMNVELPLIGGRWDVILVGAVMLVTVLAVIFIFRRRRMM